MADKKPPFKPNRAGLNIRTQANAIIDKVKGLKTVDVPKFARKLIKESKTKMTYDLAISIINKATSLIPHPAAKIAGKVILKGGEKLVKKYHKSMKKEDLAKKRKHKAQSKITDVEFLGRGKVIKKYGGPVRKAKYKDI